MRIRRLAVLLVLFIVLALPLFAQTDLYDNGPTNGTTDAWTINFGFTVSDTFSLSSGTEVGALSFAAWLFPGDILESAEVSITSSEFGGITYFDSTVNFTPSNCATNQFGFSVCSETGSFPLVSLNGGTYWLNLENAVVNSGDPVYWDENSGPSRASETSVGTIPSESFTVEGGCPPLDGHDSPGCRQPPPTTPEPSSLLLFGSGMIAVLGAGHRFLR